MKLYDQNVAVSGLTFNKKLKREHVFLNSYSRMRVNLAVQVCVATTRISNDYLKIPPGSQFIYCQCTTLFW